MHKSHAIHSDIPFRPAPRQPEFDVAVVGGGPAGATAAHELATAGRRVLLLERGGRIKPCGGAVPPILLREFRIPESLLEAKVTRARMVAPSGKHVDMEIGGFVGMVDRAQFDPWLRERAVAAGAEMRRGIFVGIDRDRCGTPVVRYREGGRDGPEKFVAVRTVIGADGANSAVAREHIPRAGRNAQVYAYHEIVASPAEADEVADFDPQRCDVYYQGRISPDFYGWVFPHGSRTSVGTGTARKGFSLRSSAAELRASAGLGDCRTVRREGAPLPLKALRRWDNGRDIVVIGDAAGAVAPSSGEGIYYAMHSGRLGAEAVDRFLETGDARCLRQCRKRFLKGHGRIFFILGVMQYFWYSSDRLREQFVKICRDEDVQRMTWDSYMNKKLVRKRPIAQVRIFFKDLAHLVGLAPR